MIDVWVNVAAVSLIGFIVWWFWFSKPKAVALKQNKVDIVVANGVYTPSRIEVPVNQPVVLRFIRGDPSPCAEKVIFEAFDTVADLPLDEPHEVALQPDRAGEFPFTCQMKMYRGTLVVKEAGS